MSGEKRVPGESGAASTGESRGEEIRRLVRAEQRLAVSQRELARQLQRLDALRRFALAVEGERAVSDVLGGAADVLLSLFAFEQCAAFVDRGEGRFVAVATRAVPGREPRDASGAPGLEVSGRTARDLPEGPTLGTARELSAAHPETVALLESALDSAGDPDGELSATASVLLLPLPGRERASRGLLALRRLSPELSFHEELPGEKDGPFLALAAQQIASAVSSAELVERLTRSYAELARTQEELVRRERLAALGELSAVVAHEVRNPLGVIFNSVSSLTRLVEEGDAAVLVDIVRQEAQRLNQIVGDLIEFARPGAPSFRVGPVEDVVRDAVLTVHASWPDALIEVETAAPLPEVRIDARLLRQALVNLIVNALQAGGGVGPVEVRIAAEKAGLREGSLRIDVVDWGPGIASGATKRIFEPFFTTKATGTGLGLVVVRRAVQAHGGEIAFGEAPEAGTVFTIRLPMGGEPGDPAAGSR